jgi:hypothetical protein
VDIIAGASLAQHTINPPSSIVKIRFWLRGRFGVAGFRSDLEKIPSPTDDRGLASFLSSGDSAKSNNPHQLAAGRLGHVNQEVRKHENA